MFLRLLWESFVRQRRRKLLAGIAILLGTTAVTAMLALATTIGDRIHKELAVYGANIIVYPKAEQLAVKVGGVDIKPTTGNAYLRESDLEKLKTIFWANNITGISPELNVRVIVSPDFQETGSGGNEFMYASTTAVGYWFNHPFNSIRTGAPVLHPWWKLVGQWPSPTDPTKGSDQSVEVVAGASIARQLHLHLGDRLSQVIKTQNPSADMHFKVSGIVTTGDATDDKLLLSLADAQSLAYGGNGVLNPHGVSDAISRVEISARTKPEDAFARRDPDTLSPKDHDRWYCSPYANSIAYQIREAIPGAAAEQVRQVEQSEGTILSRISGLMWLISAAALLAAGFAVSAAMATAILERRGEIGLMRSLGASKAAIALLFYAETGLLAILGGTLGYLIGSALAAWLGARIFTDPAAQTTLHAATIFNPVLLPVIVATALIVAIAGSTPSIRAALKMDPSTVLREDA
jgi:putative ABC transport system permease protein